MRGHISFGVRRCPLLKEPVYGYLLLDGEEVKCIELPKDERGIEDIMEVLQIAQADNCCGLEWSGR